MSKNASKDTSKPALSTFEKTIIIVSVFLILIPFITLVVMSYPATKVLINMEDKTASDLTIKITGEQWRWHYDYVESNIQYYSISEEVNNKIKEVSGRDIDLSNTGAPINSSSVLLVPSGKKIRLIVTSKDVIHSWWIPAFGSKKDAIPGYTNELFFKVNIGKEGFYYGQCVEVCGDGHPFMKAALKVVTAKEFDDWIAEGANLDKLITKLPPLPN